MSLRNVLLVASVFLPTAVFAQSPYAGMQARGIKALSDSQIADLQAGRGMGLALPAELNGYPGPIHVLELGERLGLSSEQRDQVQRLFDSMKTESVAIGVKLIEQEAELDRQFASKTVTPESLRTATAQIGATQGQLRETHLKYHLSTVAVLNPEQVERYGALRGYGGQQSAPMEHGPHRGHH